jgi:hypothetical protein
VGTSGGSRNAGGSTWQVICRALGVSIITVLFAVEMISAFVASVNPDRTVALAFLGIAAALVGIPSGYRLLVSRDGSTGSGSR